MYSAPAISGEMALNMKRDVDINPSVVAAVPSRTISMAVAVRMGWSLYRNRPRPASSIVIPVSVSPSDAIKKVNTARTAIPGISTSFRPYRSDR